MTMTKSRALFFLILITMLYLIGAYAIDLMDNDATQYATIAMQMEDSGNYLEPVWRDWEYLDKPPLLFWLSSWFFSLFGLNHFAYRLPSILINLLGVFSTYKLGTKLYSEKAGLYAAIIYASCFGIFVVNHDVRTDTMLTGFVIFSIWQLHSYLQSRKRSSFVMAFVGIGLAMLTKGPIGLMVPILSFGPYLIYQRNWKDLFRPEWLLSLLIIAVVLLPMVFGLYSQHGIKGIEFYFWTQSFGRLTGENYWIDTTGPLFFTHSFLWSFIPWTIIALIAYFKKWYLFFKKENIEILCLSGITLVFIGMSFSSYKLPHYIYVVFPLFAILAGDYIEKSFKQVKWEGFGKWFFVSQNILNILLWIALVLSFFIIKVNSWVIYIIGWYIFSHYLYSILNKNNYIPRIFTATLITMIGVTFILNTHFYPGLNPYQAGPIVGRDLKSLGIQDNEFVVFKSHRPSLDFYSGMILTRSEDLESFDSILTNNNINYVFTGSNGLEELNRTGLQFETIKSYEDYHISQLNLTFLNPKTRAKVLHTSYLLKLDNE